MVNGVAYYVVLMHSVHLLITLSLYSLLSSPTKKGNDLLLDKDALLLLFV